MDTVIAAEAAEIYSFKPQLRDGKAGEDFIDEVIRGRFAGLAIHPLDTGTSIDNRITIDDSIMKFCRKIDADKMWVRDGVCNLVEYKSDVKTASTGNAFIELVSNLTKDASGKETINAHGWAKVSCANLLVYFVPNTTGKVGKVGEFGQIAIVPMHLIKTKLEEWEKTYPIRYCKNPTYESRGVTVPWGEIVKLASVTLDLTKDELQRYKEILKSHQPMRSPMSR